ncbi:MAG: MFS transporter [Liquorilactobacillus nagelii]|jgi:EmrB/QacA subfamily drug resistance transporter|uniref:MFS transporter n=1 Tax=Liquorilactobacillus nagelii TaxID=82688 RepID=UPI00242A94A8|nr:MFS transporter [Liquorilactobacillus nagelii]MCI1920751.1 MFS transporter [Liquorilactobacillus nagelii]MCI1977649.1 MFS transporter [Liquorilactobacillus nagelii]
MKQYLEDEAVQRHRWWILGAIGLFTIMATLDGSIVNIALPVISQDLKIPMNQAEWVVSLYLIVICSLLLFFGKLGDIIGKIKIFRIGTFFFVIGSLLAGFKGNFSLLLVARGIQAFGASMTMATNNGIITEIFPFSERGKALGMIGSFVALGSIAGPGVGGLILAHFTWGYIFWINVPIGILTIILGAFILPADFNKRKTMLDYRGAFYLAIFMVSLFTAVFLGQEIGFMAPLIIVLFVVAIVCLVFFVRTELTQTEPLISFTIFKNQQFSRSLLTGFLIFVTNFFFNVISPFYLENARGLSPRIAGYILMIFPLVQVIIAPLSGAVSDRIGTKKITILGLFLILASQVGYLLTNLQTPLWIFTANVGLVGLGNGIFQAPNNTTVMSSVAIKDLGIAGGINALARNLGMVVGISGATTILFGAMSIHTGQQITIFPTKHLETFIFGMHAVFLFALIICFIGLVVACRRQSITSD